MLASTSAASLDEEEMPHEGELDVAEAVLANALTASSLLDDRRKAVLRNVELNRNILEDVGLSPRDARRLVNALLVYSSGFHRIIEEVQKTSSKLQRTVASIWRACSRDLAVLKRKEAENVTELAAKGASNSGSCGAIEYLRDTWKTCSREWLCTAKRERDALSIEIEQLRRKTEQVVRDRELCQKRHVEKFDMVLLFCSETWMHRHEKRKQLEEAITAVECRKAVLRQRQLKEQAKFEEDAEKRMSVIRKNRAHLRLLSTSG